MPRCGSAESRLKALRQPEGHYYSGRAAGSTIRRLSLRQGFVMGNAHHGLMSLHLTLRPRLSTHIGLALSRTTGCCTDAGGLLTGVMMSSSWWSQFACEPVCWSLCTVQWGLPTLALQKHSTTYEAVYTGQDADAMCNSLFTAATPAQEGTYTTFPRPATAICSGGTHGAAGW